MKTLMGTLVFSLACVALNGSAASEEQNPYKAEISVPGQHVQTLTALVEDMHEKYDLSVTIVEPRQQSGNVRLTLQGESRAVGIISAFVDLLHGKAQTELERQTQLRELAKQRSRERREKAVLKKGDDL